MHPEQVLERIQTELIEPERDTRYKIGAYSFVLSGLEYYLIKIGERRHVSGAELAVGLTEFAVKQFGPLATSVLENLGIKESIDFGYIVYNMIDLGIMGKEPHDRLEHFSDAIDIEHYCDSKDTFIIDKKFIKSLEDA